METDERLAILVAKQCTEYKIVNKMKLYKLTSEKNYASLSEGSDIVNRYSLGKPNPFESDTRKTILLVGATGSGKTTWINAMINYILGVQWDDPFRFVLVEEEVRGGSQANSQTQQVTAYDIHYRKGFRIPFSLTIVDTPGFGDSGGIARDKQVTCAVEKFFKDKNGIEELNAVGFVVQSAQARLTVCQKYILNSVLSIFGKDVEENIRFLATFADGKLPLVLTAIKEANLPCNVDRNGWPRHHKFNNGTIYVTNQDDDDDMSPIVWKNTMKSFKLFFDELSNMSTKSLKTTIQLLEKRNQLELNNFLELNKCMQDVILPKHFNKLEELRTVAIGQDDR